jgi:formate-dependent nitrite reductase cytochrome c552 subunit
MGKSIAQDEREMRHDYTTKILSNPITKEQYPTFQSYKNSFPNNSSGVSNVTGTDSQGNPTVRGKDGKFYPQKSVDNKGNPVYYDTEYGGYRK